MAAQRILVIVFTILLILQPVSSKAEDHFDWDGFFLGFGIGAKHIEVDRWSSFSGFGYYEDEGLSAGIIAGNNWLHGSWVIGVEGDFYLGNASVTGNPVARFFRAESDWMGSIRLRLGHLLGNHLLYLTGGLAFADLDAYQSDGFISESDSTIATGYTIGAGIDFWLTKELLGRFEISHSDYGDETFFQGSPLGSLRYDMDETMVKFAILFHLHPQD